MTGERADRRRPLAGLKPARGVSATVRGISIAAVIVLVALPAATVSYVQMWRLCQQAGFGGLAYPLPLTVDGLMLTATFTLWIRHRDGRSGGALAKLSVVLSIVASLAANSAAVSGAEVAPAAAHVIAVWPPVALFLAYELIVQQLRDNRRKAAAQARGTARSQVAEQVPSESSEQVLTETTGDRAPVRAQTPPPRGERRGVSMRPHPLLTPTSHNGTASTSVSTESASTVLSVSTVSTAAREIVEQAIEQAGGDPDKVNARQVAREHGIGYSTVRRHLGHIRDEQAQEATADAH